MHGRPLLVLALGSLLVLVSACDPPVGVEAPEDDYELPEADPSLDPARLAVGDYLATPCALQVPNGFDHLRGRHEWATVDVYFGRADETGPWHGPTWQDRALVGAHGGRVLYALHVPAVRARMVLSRIPGLIEDGFWVTVRDVPDDTRYDVPLSVGFGRPLADTDIERFVELGGRVEYRFDLIDALAGVLPDRSIPVLRDRPEVGHIRAEDVFCID